MKAMIAALMVLLATASAHAEEAQFLVAVEEVKNAPNNLDCGWNVEPGEIYIYGGPADDIYGDESLEEAKKKAPHIVLKVGNGIVIAPAKAFTPCPEDKTAEAAMTHGRMVQAYRENRRREAEAADQERKAEAEVMLAQQKEAERQAQLEAQRLAQEQAQIQEEEAGAFRPQTFYVSYAIYPARDVQYNDGFILRQGTQLSAKWDRQADSFSFIDSNGAPRQLPARLARETPTHRMQTDPNREAYIRQRDQAIMAGASKAELREIENQYLANEELRQIRGELESIRQDIPFRGHYRYH